MADCKRRMDSEKGVALIAAVMAVAVLLAIGLSFSFNMRLEEKAAANQMWALKAKYAAEAGIDYAIAQLKYNSPYGAIARAYSIYDSGDRSLTDDWIYWDGPGIELEDTDDPSFESDVAGNSKISGSFTIGDLTATYALKVIDCASQIYLNHDSGCGSEASTRLDEMLTALGLSGIAGGTSDNIVNYRETLDSDIYLTKEQIKDAPNVGDTRYNTIKDYVTVHAWVDESTYGDDGAATGGGNNILADTSKTWADDEWIGSTVTIVGGTGAGQTRTISDSGTNGLTVSSDWSTNPASGSTYAIIEPRSPVNVNTASREVLQAVLTGIAGAGETITSGEADSLASDIHDNRPFSTWSSFISYLTTSGVGNATEQYVILANVNPNTDIMSTNANKSWRELHYDESATNPIDKTTLTTRTTEFCFNSGGYYEIECLGKVGRDLGDGGGGGADGDLEDTSGTPPFDEVYATKKIRTVVKIFDIWRQTTQDDFLGTATEANLRDSDIGDGGAYVQSYPEPMEDTDRIAACFDGQIMLATVEPATADFTAHYNDDLDYDEGSGANAGGSVEEASVIASDQGDLLPDGVYVGDPEDLTYSSANVPAGQDEEGTLEMWVKLNYTPAAATTNYLFYVQNATGDYLRLKESSAILTLEVDDSVGSGLSDTASVAWQAGEWHHIAAVWDWDSNDGSTGGQTQLELFVDGDTDGVASQANTTYDITALPSSMYIGTDGTNEAEATIDEVIITENDTTYTADFTVADRYEETGTPTFESASLTLGSSVRWGTFTWTEHIPNGISGSITLAMDTDGDGFDDGSSSDPTTGNTFTGTTESTTIEYLVTFSATGAPLLDTPVLDGVTITYLPQTDVLYWREVTE